MSVKKSKYQSRPIAIFDSGIGGLSIMKEIKEKIPKEQIIYLADNKNFPYGKKSKKEIFKNVLNAADFLSNKNIKALIIACNTASFFAKEIEKNFDFLVFDIASFNINNVLKKRKILKKAAIFATEATISFKMYENKKNLQFSFANFVEMIEKSQTLNWIKENKLCIEKCLKKIKPFEKEIEFVLLACTHFNFLASLLEEILQKEVIDTSLYFANSIKSSLKEKNLLSFLKEKEDLFYASKEELLWQKKLKNILNKKVEVKKWE